MRIYCDDAMIYLRNYHRRAILQIIDKTCNSFSISPKIGHIFGSHILQKPVWLLSSCWSRRTTFFLKKTATLSFRDRRVVICSMTILKISTMLRENKKNICKAFIIIQCHSGYFLRHSPSSMTQFAAKPPRTIPVDDHVETRPPLPTALIPQAGSPNPRMLATQELAHDEVACSARDGHV